MQVGIMYFIVATLLTSPTWLDQNILSSVCHIYDMPIVHSPYKYTILTILANIVSRNIPPTNPSHALLTQTGKLPKCMEMK